MSLHARNIFTNEISKLAIREDYEEVIETIDNLKGRDREAEINVFGDKFGLETKKTLRKIRLALAETINSKQIKEDLEVNALQYKQYYDKFQKESFHNAQEIVVAVLNYIKRITEHYERRIEHILLSNPGIEEKVNPRIRSYLLGESSQDNQEKKSELGNMTENQREKIVFGDIPQIKDKIPSLRELSYFKPEKVEKIKDRLKLVILSMRDSGKMNTNLSELVPIIARKSKDLEFLKTYGIKDSTNNNKPSISETQEGHILWFRYNAETIASIVYYYKGFDAVLELPTAKKNIVPYLGRDYNLKGR